MRDGPTFIALVGADGTGKSTQAALLAAALRSRGRRARAFEHPGGRPVLDAVAQRLGRAHGGALLGEQRRIRIETAVRAAAIARTVAWARATGGVAVMDRSALCQIATILARGLPVPGWISSTAARAPRPDVTVWLRLEPGAAVARIRLRGAEREDADWVDAFDSAYPAAAGLLGVELVEVDASGPADAVADRIQAVLPLRCGS